MFSQEFYHTAQAVDWKSIKAPKRTAVLIQSEHILYGVGIPQTLCEDALAVRAAAKQGDTGQLRLRVVPETFYRFQDDGVARIPAGLVERVDCALRSRQITVEHVNQKAWPSLENAWKRLANEKSSLPGEELQRRIIFATRPRSHFQVRSVRQAAEILASAAAAFPKEPIHVIVKNKEVQSRLARSLQELGPVNVSTPESDPSYPSHKAVVISCGQYFATEFTRTARLIVIVGADVAQTDTVTNNADVLNHVLRCCISIGERSTGERGLMHIESLFGPKLDLSKMPSR
ncbi:hypothetical protein NA78x_002889 [Anatilimnocola sp. NA78]|uniref:hypothetical protein n=1 Tax=Anatilimnocola sp. NA78 TaxID=3415683 RepID=UPI003CE566BE